MSKLTKPISKKRLIELAATDDPQIKRLVWEISQSRHLLRQTRNLLEHWGEENWEIIFVRDTLMEKLGKRP